MGCTPVIQCAQDVNARVAFQTMIDHERCILTPPPASHSRPMDLNPPPSSSRAARALAPHQLLEGTRHARLWRRRGAKVKNLRATLQSGLPHVVTQSPFQVSGDSASPTERMRETP